MIIFLLLNFAFADELSFQNALDAMINTNVDVLIQRTKVSASEAQLLAARGSFTPSINLQAQEQNSGGNATSFAGTTVYPTAQVYSANATWNVFRSGADVASLHAASKDLSLQNSQLAYATLQAEDKSARALIDLVERRMVVDSLKRSEASAKHFAEIAEARFSHSLLSREEADKVSIDAINAESKRTDAEMQFNDAQGTVEALLGHDQVALEWPWISKLTLDSVKDRLRDDADRDAIELRPDVHAAQFSYESQDSRDRALFRSMLPTVDLSYSVGETHLSGGTTSSWSGLATLTIPLWNGYHDYAAYRVQVENRNAAEAQLKQLQRDVIGSVHSAQLNYRIAVEQYQSRARNLGLAKHILDQDGIRFKMGRADANELDLDLRRVTEAEVLAIQGIAQAHIAYMQLLHVFGQRAL